MLIKVVLAVFRRVTKVQNKMHAKGIQFSCSGKEHLFMLAANTKRVFFFFLQMEFLFGKVSVFYIPYFMIRPLIISSPSFLGAYIYFVFLICNYSILYFEFL